ncbi:aminopeptidase N-like [Argopecten irradians]|uniref:aminopeptidase N-like n=1 Tax=Argopecten irradians TaxID=31199 RepID=UPI003717B3DC
MFTSSTERFDFSNMDDYPGEGKRPPPRTDGSVCHISIAAGFILTLLSLAIAVGVGIIVNFAGNNKNVTCSCLCEPSPQTTNAPGYIPSACKALALEGNQEICGLCPDSTVTSTHSTTSAAPTDTTEVTKPTEPPIITDDIRLPDNMKPYHYDITIRPELYNDKPETFTFSGRVDIFMNCIKATKNITVHSGSQVITQTPSVRLVNNTGGRADPGVIGTARDDARQFLIIMLDTYLTIGEQYSLTLHFTANLTDNLIGLYLSSYYSEEANATKYLAVTQLQHTYARFTFPCFDEPALKAKFAITLEREPQIFTLSNMPLLRSDNLTDGYIADVYDTTVIMPTYLVAFAFCDFLNVTNKTSNNVEFSVFSRPEYINQTTFALEEGIKMLDAFENYFNISYTLPKLDNIALPDFYYGAMENWGLVTYREAYLLYEPGMTTTSYLIFIAEIIAHELAHMWFGNIVSPVWWDDIWLNEGFATFLSYLGVEMVLPEWKMMDLITTDVIQRVMDVDSYESTVPIYRMAYTPRQIGDLFDSITYSKGASVIRMMWFFLGEETFRRGLEGYLKEQMFGNVAHDDLWVALQKQAQLDGRTGFDVKTVMDTWIKQKNFPVVNVTRHGNQLKLTQQRFLLGATNTTDSEGYSWEIPFTYTTQQKLDFNQTTSDITWIRKDSSETTIDSVTPDQGWVIGNIRQYGYYRVNYDTENWQAIVRQLMNDHTKIHVINRGVLISDSWALAKAGLISMEIAWDMLIYLRNETEYMPWDNADRELDYIDMMLTGRAAYGDFERFVVTQIEGRSLNVPIYDDRPVQQRSLSRLIFSLACKHHVPECIERSLEMFDAWRTNGTLIPPDIKGTVMCTAVREGGETEWDYLYSRYLNGPVSETGLALAALGCSSRPWIINRYLEYSLQSDKIRKQDTRNAILSVLRNPVAFYMGWKFLMMNWRQMTLDNAVDGNHLNDIIRVATQGMYTDFELSQVMHLKNNIHPQEVELSGFDRAIDRIMVNMEWEEQNYPFVEEWLKTNVGHTA